MAKNPTSRRSKGRASSSAAAPHYHGHRERLRARFREAGTEAVTDYELLELCCSAPSRARDVKPLAKEMIAKFGSFAEVLGAPEKRLQEVKGIREATVDRSQDRARGRGPVDARRGAKAPGAVVLVERA